MKSPAFTMIEALIVLAITALIIGITLPSMSRSERLLGEQQFWRSMRKEWHQSQLRAELNHYPTEIEYDPFTREIIFKWFNGKSRLPVPATLQVVQFDKVEISETGYSRARTQEFRSKINGHRYLMKIQLAWGGYRFEEKK